MNENSFPEYDELSNALKILVDDDKNQYENEMSRNQQGVAHHTVSSSSHHDPDNDRSSGGSSGGGGFGLDNFPRYIY